MRRWIAATLATFLALPVLLPYLRIDAETKVPPCCRRQGAHQCGMRSNLVQTPADRSAAFRAGAASCPYQKALTPSYRVTVLPRTSAAVYASVFSHPAIQVQTFVSGLVSKSRSHQKRGPPFSVSC
jgi:hypothetical protein